MSLKDKSTVKVPLGMRHSWFFPILQEDENAHPKYDAKIDMGHAVKGYLALTSVSAEIPGDDDIQLSIEKFASGQLDVETTMSDLEVNAKLYGHSYTDENGEISSEQDAAALGGYAFVEPIMKKDKKLVYRASCFYKVQPIAGSEKQEADTKKGSEIAPKMNAVALKVLRDKSGAWRQRKDFESLDAADAWIDTIFPKASLPA